MLHFLDNRKICRRIASVFLAGTVLTGCATITGGTAQTVEVTSDPEGATVTFSPSGQTLVTPAVIELDRSTDHVAVFRLDGHDEVTLRINRAPRGELYGSAVIPVLGPALLAIDAASDAEFDLHPDPVNVSLQPADSRFQVEAAGPADERVIVFNRNTVAGEVYFAFNGAEPCKLEKWQMTSVELEDGPHDLTVFHWDLFKFSDDYEVDMPDGARFIGVFSGVGSTNFSYYDDIPRLKKEFEEVSCDSEIDAQGITEAPDIGDTDLTG